MRDQDRHQLFSPFILLAQLGPVNIILGSALLVFKPLATVLEAVPPG